MATFSGSNSSIQPLPLNAKYHLLTLTLEIRMMVYELLYPPGVPTTKAVTQGDDVEIYQPTALIKTCSQIYNEAGPVLYRNICIDSGYLPTGLLLSNTFTKHIEQFTINIYPARPPIHLRTTQDHVAAAAAKLTALRACTIVLAHYTRFYLADSPRPQASAEQLHRHIARIQPFFDEDLMRRIPSTTLVLTYIADKGEIIGKVDYRFDIKDIMWGNSKEQLHDAAINAHMEEMKEPAVAEVIDTLSMMSDSGVSSG